MRHLRILMLIVVATGCRPSLHPYEFTSSAMSPTIKPGEILVVDSTAYTVADPKRWDVIVFKYPKDASDVFAMRVVGLPGEKLEIKNGLLVINGSPLSVPEKLQNIFKDIPAGLYPESTVSIPPTIPPRCYYVLGDNVRRANDSRTWGHLRQDLIIGKVLDK